MIRYWLILLIFFMVTSLALGQSYDGSSAREATLMNMDEYGWKYNMNRIRTMIW